MTEAKRDAIAVIADALAGLTCDGPSTRGNSDGDAKPAQYLPLFDQGGHFYLWHIARELGIGPDVEAALQQRTYGGTP